MVDCFPRLSSHYFSPGGAYAPNCVIDGVNIQDYLQNHFIEACGRLADRIAAFEGGSLLDGCVIGWDSMNEPFEGFCGWEDVQVNPTAQDRRSRKARTRRLRRVYDLGWVRRRRWRTGLLVSRARRRMAQSLSIPRAGKCGPTMWSLPRHQQNWLANCRTGLTPAGDGNATCLSGLWERASGHNTACGT